jgi:hypothetical protein
MMGASVFSPERISTVQSIDLLASLVHPRGGRKWRNRFVMMEAYFDESGIHDGAKVCIVAGYYGSHSAWKRFESQWNKILADYPEVAVKGFHAKVFFGRDESGNRVKEYKGVLAQREMEKRRSPLV